MGLRDKFKNVFGLNNDENSIDETQIEKIDSSKTKLSSNDVLFVCMTNTVVSPIAEAIFNLFSGDGEAFSAGLKAQSGNKSSQDAIDVCEKYGVDLSNHMTSNINDFSLDDVGLILTSTSQIRDTLKMKHSNIDIFTIKEYAEDYADLDILDPFDGDSSGYDECFNEINSAIIKIIRRDIDIVDEPLVGEEIAEEPIKTIDDSIDVNDNYDVGESFDKPLEISNEELKENKEEVNDGPTQVRNFKYLDDLIHSGVKEIVLDSNIVLGNYEESDYRKGIKLNVDDLVIDGKGHAISAERKTRIFKVTGNNIIIKNIKLENGYVQKEGGAIYIEGGTLTVSDSTLEGNTAKHGGAIYIEGGTLNVSGSTLEGNRAQGSGGAIENWKGTLTVSGSTLQGNKANVGGAIVNRGELTISGSILQGNLAKYDGGAIGNVLGTLNVSGSILQGNKANVGGAIDNGGELTISGSTLQGNKANRGGAIYNNDRGEVAVSDSTLQENMAKDDGGAIRNSEGSFNVFNCDFSSNKSSINIMYNKGSLQIFNSDFMSNHASNIIVNSGDSANLSIFKGEFKDNDIKGSIIFNDGKSCAVEKTIFEKHPSNTIINKSDLILITPKIKDESKTILNEKYISIKKSSDEIEDKIYGDGIVENESKFEFKEFDFGYLDKKIHESKIKEIILEEDISFENYEISHYEGGIVLDIDNLIIDGNGHTIDAQEKTQIFNCIGKNITIKNLTLKNGHSNKNDDHPFNKGAGAIKINYNAKLTLKNCKFINNTSEEFNGVIHNKGTLTIMNSILQGNKANRGGAIYNHGGCELIVSDSTLEGNTAKNDGGAIHNEGTLTIINSILQGNKANVGGAISNHLGCELFVSGSTFIGNTAEGVVGDFVVGGAIYNDGGELTVSDSTLTGSTAKYGGAIYNRKCGDLTITDSTLQGNIAQLGSGGAIYNDDGVLTITDSTLQGNIAQLESGGAIYNRKGDLTLTDSTFTENMAKYDGGAIYIREGGVLTITDSTLQGNLAQLGFGGAIYNDDGVLTITDSTLQGNLAQLGSGGAIYNDDGELTIQGSTLYENMAQEGSGGAICTEKGKLIIFDSLFTENFANKAGMDIFNSGHVYCEENISKGIQIHNNDFGKFYHLKSLKNNQNDFNYLNELIHSETNEIKLENDIILNIEKNEQKTFENGIEIDRDNLVIDGNGHTINAQRLTRIFYCTGKNIVIKNIILKNGFTEKLGGAISNYECELTIHDSTLVGNIAQFDGGAIYNDKSKLMITQSNLHENTSQRGFGGAICNWKGGLTITDSTLTGNAAQMRSGGAICNWKGGLTITDSTLTGNTTDYGGTISNYEEKSFYIKGCKLIKEQTVIRNFKYLDDLIHSGVKEIILDSDIVFDHDKESQDLKGIELDVDDLTIDGKGHTIDAKEKTVIFKCTGKNIVIKNVILKNAVGGSRWNGGAIYNDGGELTISDSTITENRTLLNYGGALANNGGGKLTIISSSLTGNIVPEGYGGAICNEGKELTICDSTFTENTAKWGGAIYNGGGELTIKGSTLSRNMVKSDGVIYNEKGNFKVFDCDFSNNESSIVNKDLLQIFNSNFMNNCAPNIIVNTGDLANISIFKGEFKDNDINKSIIFNEGKSCTVEKTIFEKHPSNTIINKSDLTLIGPKIKGGGKLILNEKCILIKKSSVGLEDKIYGDGTVENVNKFNFEEFDFGYLDKKIHESKNKEVILEEDISFENYETDYYEGGIELDIDNLIIDGNGHTIDAKDKTRIFCCTGKNITIKNLALKNGHSHKNYDNPFNNNGGAIKINYDANLTIENCKFINNISEEYGGAIHNRGMLILYDSTTLEGNTAEGCGGAIHNSDGGELTIIDSLLNENTAQKSGGAIENTHGDLTIYDSTLTGNNAQFDGGAIDNSGKLTISGSTFTRNAVSYGGAIDNSGKLTISGSTLTGNKATNEGGAIRNYEGELTIYDSTFAGNNAQFDGGAIYNYKGSLIINDSTLAENRAKWYGGAIFLSKLTEGYSSNNCTFKDNDLYEEED